MLSCYLCVEFVFVLTQYIVGIFYALNNYVIPLDYWVVFHGMDASWLI